MENKFSPAISLLKPEMEIRNYSDNSVKAYCEIMQSFELYTNKTLDQLTSEDLKQYLHYLVKEKKVLSATQFKNKRYEWLFFLIFIRAKKRLKTAFQSPITIRMNTLSIALKNLSNLTIT